MQHLCIVGNSDLIMSVPRPEGLKQQSSPEKGTTTTNWGSGDEKEGDKTKILFMSHLLLGNGGFIKLKTTDGICSGAQDKPVLGKHINVKGMSPL